MIFLVSFSVFGFFCIVFRFPIIDDDLLCLGTEIDRLSYIESLIELGDIVASDILFATCHEMSLHYIRECIYEYVEWLPILTIVSFFVRTHCLLECVYNLGRLTRIAEYERLITKELHHYIWYPKDRVDPRIGSDLHAFDFLEWDDDQIRGEKLPTQIDQRLLREDPYIRVPVKYLIDEDKIYHEEIRIKMPCYNHSLDACEVEIVEKSWHKECKKNPKNNILDNHEKMSMKNMLYRLFWSNIWWEKEGLKSIHEVWLIADY